MAGRARVVRMCRGLAELTRLRLISANGADVASTATPVAASKKTALGPIIGGPHTCHAALMLCYASAVTSPLFSSICNDAHALAMRLHHIPLGFVFRLWSTICTFSMAYSSCYSICKAVCVSWHQLMPCCHRPFWSPQVHSCRSSCTVPVMLHCPDISTCMFLFSFWW